MAYSTGVANDLWDLMAKVRALIEPAGWITRGVDETDWYFQDAQGTSFFNIHLDPQAITTARGDVSAPGLYICGSSSHFDDSPWNQQPNSSMLTANRVLNGLDYAPTLFSLQSSGPFARFHLFYSSTFWHLVVEPVTNTFAHLLIGTLNKEGASYSGGQYLACSLFRFSITDPLVPSQRKGNGFTGAGYFPFATQAYDFTTSRLRVDNQDNLPGVRWFPGSAPAGRLTEGMVTGMGDIPPRYDWDQGTGYGSSMVHPSYMLVQASANSLNNSTMLVPHTLYAAGAQQRCRYMGRIPDMFICDMDYLAPGDVLTYGTEQFMVFPAYRKGQDFYYTSTTLGYAYKVAG